MMTLCLILLNFALLRTYLLRASWDCFRVHYYCFPISLQTLRKVYTVLTNYSHLFRKNSLSMALIESRGTIEALPAEVLALVLEFASTHLYVAPMILGQCRANGTQQSSPCWSLDSVHFFSLVGDGHSLGMAVKFSRDISLG